MQDLCDSLLFRPFSNSLYKNGNPFSTFSYFSKVFEAREPVSREREAVVHRLKGVKIAKAERQLQAISCSAERNTKFRRSYVGARRAINSEHSPREYFFDVREKKERDIISLANLFSRPKNLSNFSQNPAWQARNRILKYFPTRSSLPIFLHFYNCAVIRLKFYPLDKKRSAEK